MVQDRKILYQSIFTNYSGVLTGNWKNWKDTRLTSSISKGCEIQELRASVQ